MSAGVRTTQRPLTGPPRRTGYEFLDSVVRSLGRAQTEIKLVHSASAQPGVGFGPLGEPRG